MASNTATKAEPRFGTDPVEPDELALGPAIRAILAPLASLKLTVVLLAMAIFLVFAGTLAQTRKDIWVVVDEYFRTGIAWIDFQVFFPKSFFPDMDPVSGGLYFPGGWLIGVVMAINLIAAHAVRFTVQSSGTRLTTGLVVIGLGAFLTWVVIASGSSDGLQGVPFFEWSTLWTGVKFALAAASIAGAWLVTRLGSDQRVERRLLGASSAIACALALWLFYKGDDVALGDSSMRILWQLIQGGIAGLVLLGGCWLVFRKRAGIVLLHGGIALMMLSELLVGTLAVETQMQIREGETVNFVQDLRKLELAVIDRSNPGEDNVTVVPMSVLLRGVKRQHAFLPRWLYEPLPDGVQAALGCRYGEPVISSNELPFDVEVVRFMKNSTPRKAKADDDNPATAGAGRQWIAEERQAATGTDNDSKVDMSSAYVKLLKKGSGESLGTYLVGLFLSLSDFDQPVTVDGETYDLSLRLKRTYKPYNMTLLDVRADTYLGTDTTRNYSSDIHIVDPTRNVDRKVHIWMNNPLRFAGETFYQSQFFRDPDKGVETTGLQVVANTGWMLPYVSCMIVGTGMLFQFVLTLLRFLKRSDRGAMGSLAYGMARGNFSPNVPATLPAGGRPGGKGASDVPLARADSGAPLEPAGRSSLFQRLVPWAIVLVFAAYVAGKARPAHVSDDAFNFYEAGKLPVVYQGRVKPLDTLARNSLKIVSWKETFADDNGKTQPAVRWLLDIATAAEGVENYKVFWIDSPDVLELFELKPRKSHQYSGAELAPHLEEFQKKIDETRGLPPAQLSVFQRRLIELEKRMNTVKLLQGTFLPPHIGELPTEKDIRSNDPAARARVAQLKEALVDLPRRLAAVHPPLVVPVKVDRRDPHAPQPEGPGDYDWQPYSTAFTKSFVATRLLGQDPDPATVAWQQIFVAYGKNEPQAFNKAVRDYRALLGRESPEQLAGAHVDFETFFNHFAPFYYSAVLYLIVFALAALSWLGWSGPLNRAAFWLAVVALAVHTFALVSRIYISGRPPVTNLYSTAVFIGWGCVVFCLVFERMYRFGIGNVVAGVTGFATLLISHFLSGDGDTFTVLQAVLDTQFWLATHVVIINAGYAATLLAGMLGVLYVIRGLATPTLEPAIERDLARMIYGTLCFALFFSFVGTVLGGLWADDSWGRFWGWDPKENGALIIVLWNALVVHARWDGLVRNRGMAVLAVGGNIVTAWSWFGVNELGVGLHSYGFTAGVLRTLAWFVASQLAVIALGLVPKEHWWSIRAQRNTLPG